MELRNKITGEIGSVARTDANEAIVVYYPIVDGVAVNPQQRAVYHSLAELVEEWEDVTEETKEYWYINAMGFIFSCNDLSEETIKELKLIGNYFDSEEEAKLAVEKLKAFKRLKDKGFRFEGIKEDYARIPQVQDPSRTGKRYLQFNKSEDEDWMKENWKDLDTLFSGEDD